MKEIKLYDTYYKYFDDIEIYHKESELINQKMRGLSSFDVDGMKKLQDKNILISDKIRQLDQNRTQFDQDYFNKFHEINKTLRNRQNLFKNPSTDSQLKVDLKKLIEHFTIEKNNLLNKFYDDRRYN